MQGDFKIAHCGGFHSFLNLFIKAVNLVAKLLHHHIRWDTETIGCDPRYGADSSPLRRVCIEGVLDGPTCTRSSTLFALSCGCAGAVSASACLARLQLPLGPAEGSTAGCARQCLAQRTSDGCVGWHAGDGEQSQCHMETSKHCRCQ